MKAAAFHKAAMALPGVTLDIKWGADRCYCVGGKMFAVAGHEGEDEPRYCFKASDASFEQLTEEGVAEPAPYLARAKWVLLKGAHVLPDDQLRAYIAQAHRLIAEKLTK
jgi:predicted DNA-binding protein (MmcQ/YjbR family)